MNEREELTGIVDANLYLTLATADADGRPWVSPVYFAHEAYREFFWVSRPSRRHSQNVAARPEVAIVVFDSQVPISTGRAVYLAAVAEQLGGDDVERGIAVFSRRSLSHGGRAWTLADVEDSAPFRLYRATATERFVLSASDDRIPVSLG
jgi:nitroimidazol reductase NimA-like FMN-containing flavoprotein (pyridoxamine 5'-phosphate oxidase superfamily)